MLRRHVKSCYPFLWQTKHHKITAEPNHSTKNQELRHLVCHTTPIRAILKGLNHKKENP